MTDNEISNFGGNIFCSTMFFLQKWTVFDFDVPNF